MNQFNYNAYLKNNPLLKETNGIGNYVQPEKMFGSPDRISNRDYDNMTDDELDAAEKAGDLNSSNAPLGPDEELMEDDDSSLFGPNIEKSRPGNLSDYYRSAEPTVKHVAKEIDDILSSINNPNIDIESLSDLIVALADAYGQEQVDNYRSDMSTM
jgi:hypothetical protein